MHANRPRSIRRSQAPSPFWATTKRYHLPMVKVGSLVRYRLADLEKFLELCIVRRGCRVTQLKTPTPAGHDGVGVKDSYIEGFYHVPSV